MREARDDAAECKACPLWEDATQTVFGEGPADASFLLVGEQPGDKEDLQGHPFVGPAGRLLDRALADAGIDRRRAYVTNAVKHFKFQPRGKRRMHQKPNTMEIEACLPWLQREIDLLKPKLVVALGATALRALFGRAVPVLANRGRILRREDEIPVLVTVHPSSLLRARDDESRQRGYAAFVQDLKNGEMEFGGR